VNFFKKNFTISTYDKESQVEPQMDLSLTEWTYFSVTVDLFCRAGGLFGAEYTPKERTRLKILKSPLCTAKKRKCTKDCNTCTETTGDCPHILSKINSKTFIYYLIYTIYAHLIIQSNAHKPSSTISIIIPVPIEIWLELRKNFITLAKFHLTQIDRHSGNNKNGINSKVSFYFHPFSMTNEGIKFDGSITGDDAAGYKVSYGERLSQDEPGE
jgi:hypothetical protein